MSVIVIQRLNFQKTVEGLMVVLLQQSGNKSCGIENQ